MGCVDAFYGFPKLTVVGFVTQAIDISMPVVCLFLGDEVRNLVV